MSDTIILTSIYGEFWGTKQFRRSCALLNLPIHNAFKGKRFTGNGDAIRMLYEAFIELKDKYKYLIYSDGADTFFVEGFEPPPGIVIYSAEKAVWPPLPSLNDAYKEYYETYKDDLHYQYTPWLYLNAGNFCGEIKLLIEFYEKYGLNKLRGDVNGQKEISEAYLKAYKEGFPITLDVGCTLFQSIAFEHVNDFSLHPDGKRIINNITGTVPKVYHGNGRTSMEPIYQRF
jgi:hypothetical protein